MKYNKSEKIVIAGLILFGVLLVIWIGIETRRYEEKPKMLSEKICIDFCEIKKGTLPRSGYDNPDGSNICVCQIGDEIKWFVVKQ